MAILLGIAPASAEPQAVRAFDEPERLGARFSFDESVWRRLPSKPGFGLTLSCHLAECRPGEWPGLALCQIAFFPDHDPRWASTAKMAQSIDMRWSERMTAATIAAPTARRGRVTSGFRPCANGADALCMSVALEGQGPAGIGFAFMTARNGYRVQGDCRFLPPMVQRGPKLFEAVLKGLRWD